MANVQPKMPHNKGTTLCEIDGEPGPVHLMNDMAGVCMSCHEVGCSFFLRASTEQESQPLNVLRCDTYSIGKCRGVVTCSPHREANQKDAGLVRAGLLALRSVGCSCSVEWKVYSCVHCGSEDVLLKKMWVVLSQIT